MQESYWKTAYVVAPYFSHSDRLNFKGRVFFEPTQREFQLLMEVIHQWNYVVCSRYRHARYLRYLSFLISEPLDDE